MRSNFNNSKFKAGRQEKPFLFREMELISFAKRFVWQMPWAKRIHQNLLVTKSQN